METYIITNINDFNQIYKNFKASAEIETSGESRFLIGLDLEYCNSIINSTNWVPNSNTDKISCVLQLATETYCLIFDLKKLKTLPVQVIDILQKDSWIKLGIGIDNDMNILTKNYNLNYCGGVIELKNFALMNIKKPNLEYLYNLLFNTNVNNKTNQYDWEDELTEEMIKYCAGDSIMSYKIGKLFYFNSSGIFKQKKNDFDIIIKNNLEFLKNDEINPISKLNTYAQCNNLELPKYIYSSKEYNRFICYCSFNNIEFTSSNKNSKKSAKIEVATKIINYFNI
jgi:hypothetical protein